MDPPTASPMFDLEVDFADKNRMKLEMTQVAKQAAWSTRKYQHKKICALSLLWNMKERTVTSSCAAWTDMNALEEISN